MNAPRETDSLVTLDEAAQTLGVSRKTLQREINSGRFPASIRVGKRSLTRVANIEPYQQMLAAEVAVREEEKKTIRVQYREKLKHRRFEQILASQEFLEQYRRSAFSRLSEESVALPVRRFDAGDPARLP